MTQSLKELLQTVEVTDSQRTGRLQVFGLRWPIPNGFDYLTLDEALADKTLEVSEVSEGGSVPTLKVVNKGAGMVFLMAGEQLVGAKQNRVLNVSILVGAKTELPIPVSCVEAGRWRYQSHKFASPGTMSHSKLRQIMCGHAHEGYRAFHSPTSNQGEVWREVAGKLAKMSASSPSQALNQAYEDHQQRLDEMLGRLHMSAEACGAVFVVGSKIAGADLFDRPATLAKLWSKLVRAYAIDALEEGSEEEASALDVRIWLRSVAEATAEPFPSPGLGTDVRLESPALAGAGLVLDDHPVHVELFTREQGK